jgi:LmbE family N-acetylglucosaminyl deacetylase
MEEFITLALYYQTQKVADPTLFSVPRAKTSIIMAPHPDDEILCCASTIQQKISQHEKVKVIFLTSGDAKKSQNPSESITYGKYRERESREAAHKLGLKESDLFFLNFPDQGLAKLPQNENTYTSPYTQQNYTQEQAYFPHIPYNQDQLELKIKELVRLFQPEEIYYPHPYKDRHPDHKATGLLTEKILRENPYIEGHSYAIHAGFVPQKDPRKTLETSQKYQKKLSLIRTFQSQFHDANHKKFLESFAFVPEKFDRFLQKFARK